MTVVGTLTDLTPGEAIVAHGRWRNDPKVGWQFQARDYRTALPATLQGRKRYLDSSLIKGLGPVNAARIVDIFGEATFEVIDRSPDRLREGVNAERWLAAGRQAAPSVAILDSRTLQSTPESGARAGYDGHERKQGSKVHLAVDSLGHLLALDVTPASEQDRRQVETFAKASRR